MTRLEFLVEGSGGGEYSVVFEFDGNKARATCTCQAGVNRQFCKHRTELLDGIITNLRSSNPTDLTRLGSLMEGTDLKNAYVQMLEATKTHDEARKLLDAAKKKLSRVAHQ